MKVLAVVVFCAVVFSVRANVVRFGDTNTMLYDPDTAKVSKCYHITCPSGTAACSKVMKTTNNLETITTTFKCENENGDVLHSQVEYSENPYPGVKIQSFSFSGVYHMTSNNVGSNGYPAIGFGNVDPVEPSTDRYNYERNKYNTNDLDSQVETFDK